MCNMAGYVGERAAAEVLPSLVRPQEGFWSGYYAGIVTLDGETLHSRKLLGDTKLLYDTTDAATLPGNIGILHSRSGSGGDGEWAHPFVGAQNEMAYAAVGGSGYFKQNGLGAEAEKALIEELFAEGYPLISRSETVSSAYPPHPLGGRTHVSEVMCRLIARYHKAGLSGAAAMEAAYCHYPAELNGMTLFADEPGKLTIAITNGPLCIARADDGYYVVNTALAFPASVKTYEEIPLNSSVVVTKDGYTVRPFAAPPADPMLITPTLYTKAYEAMYELLRDGVPLGKLSAAVRALFPADRLSVDERLTYEILRGLRDEGRLEMTLGTVPGMIPELTAPDVIFSLKK